MCTGIKLVAQNNAVTYARTLEFGQNLDSKIIMIPRNYVLTSLAPSGQGLQWKTKYAAVGANACGVLTILDGVNEQGLGGGLFYFPDYAYYQTVTKEEEANSIAPWDLMTWVLTTCDSVAQVKELLPTIKVSNTFFDPWKIVPPVHAIVHDAQGFSLVIEYIDGKLIMHDNPIGTCTNAPSFDWHMTNLKNYINLSPVNIDKAQLGPICLTSTGQGSGMLGLPGDFTPPSRFVRAAFLSQTAMNMTTEYEAIHTAFHILNLFNIPQGTVREKIDNGISCDYTQWTSAADLKNKCYYFHTYDNRQIHMINLMRMTLDAQDPVVKEMRYKEGIADITSL